MTGSAADRSHPADNPMAADAANDHGAETAGDDRVAPVGPRCPEAAQQARADIGSASPARPDRFGVEIVLVLAISLGMAAVNAVIDFADVQTRGGFGNAVATLNPSRSPRAWVDLAYQLTDLLAGFAPALLALLLLSRTPGGPGFGIGLDRRHLARDSLHGLGFAALIWLPGLALLALARYLGVDAHIEAAGIGDTWYRYPVLVLQGIQNGFEEQLIMIGFLLTRLRQLHWPRSAAIVLSAGIRGGYHLYQGPGGLLGNAVMGAIFGWWFTRTRRILPLIIAHSLIDAVSFVGYAALRGHLGWI